MGPLDFARALLRSSAGLSASDEGTPALRADELRCTLEYSSAPNIMVQAAAMLLADGSSNLTLMRLAIGNPLDRFLALLFPQREGGSLQRDPAVAHAFVELGLAPAKFDLGADLYADPELESVLRSVESASVLGGVCCVPSAMAYPRLRAAPLIQQ